MKFSGAFLGLPNRICLENTMKNDMERMGMKSEEPTSSLNFVLHDMSYLIQAKAFAGNCRKS